MKLTRSSGVLLHPTCLPSPYGIGDLGPAAHAYVRWLAEAGVGWWQVLPLNPPGPGFSPYSATSTFAGNELLISPGLLLEQGLLGPGDLEGASTFGEQSVEYEAVAPFKRELLRRAATRFAAAAPAGLADEFEEFRQANARWLDDYALFAALKQAHGGAAWYDWPTDLALRRSGALTVWRGAHAAELTTMELGQFLFFRQWRALRAAAAECGVRILGDVPIFVAYDSADVWANRELFQLDGKGRPTVVAGVPPDYFSDTGQLWGNPLYQWERHRADGFGWWVRRLRHALDLVDAVRLDHFRGFAAHWEVPAGDETAAGGSWVEGPGRALFDAVRAEIGDLPLVAEDLGVITDDVVALRDGLDLPGMAILHFAFNPADRSAYLPYRHRRDLVVYTGTHDNNTTVGWWQEDLSEAERTYALRYTGADGREIHWDLIRLALSSVADLAVVPHQDLAGLGADCRMNTPGVGEGNWRFRLTEWMLDPALQTRLADLVETFGRSRRPG